jgi:hypothetical protein
MRRFMLTNKVGYDLKNAVENPDFSCSEIHVLDNDGTLLDVIPWTPTTDYMYDPKPDPRYQKPFIAHMESGEVRLNPMIPENHVASGENPYVQLIYNFTKKTSHTYEEICRHIINEKNVLSDDRPSRLMIKSLINEMFDGDVLGGLLIKRGSSYHAGVDIKLGQSLRRLHSGYNIFEYETINYIKNNGTVSKDEIYSLLSYSSNRLRWIRNDSTVEYIIKKLLKQKNIIKMGENWYRFLKLPERMM